MKNKINNITKSDLVTKISDYMRKLKKIWIIIFIVLFSIATICLYNHFNTSNNKANNEPSKTELQNKSNDIETKEKEDIETEEKPAYNIKSETGILYANTNVNIRALPTVDSDIIGYLFFNQSVEKTGICDNGWTEVKYENGIGYINSKYIQDTKTEILVSKESKKVEQQPYSGIIQREGNISDSMLYSIESYYCMVPSNVRNLLESNGWQYICSDADFTGRYGPSHEVLAMTAYGDKLIYINNKDSARDAITHEVGHAFDSSMEFISNSSEFMAIFNEEHDNFCNVWNTHSNNTSTASEYFAETFSVIVMNPELVKGNCPKTYEYITRYINNV